MPPIQFNPEAGAPVRAVRPQAGIIASAARAGADGPLRPSRPRLDPDRVVGAACALLLPVALWLALG